MPVVKMGTGSASGTYYPLGNAIAELLTDTTKDYIVNAYTGSASVSNTKLLGEGVIDMALVQNNVAYWAQNGIGLFAGNKIDNINGIAVLYPEMIQVVVRKGAGIHSIEDLEGKNVNLGPDDSGNYFDAVKIIEAHEINLKQIKVHELSFSEAITGFRDGSIDAAFITSGIPTETVLKMGAVVDIEILSIDEKIINQLIERNPYYSLAVIPKETYKELKEDLVTITTSALWVCDSDMDEDLVYEMTKNFWEHQAKIETVHPVVTHLKVENSTVNMGITMHKGARRYYEEIGFE
jgi:TRAP transporter TAXI family solute receptor